MFLTSVAPGKPSSSSPSLSPQSQSRLFEIKVQRKIRLGICGECGWVGESLRGNTKEAGNRMDALLLLLSLRYTHFSASGYCVSPALGRIGWLRVGCNGIKRFGNFLAGLAGDEDKSNSDLMLEGEEKRPKASCCKKDAKFVFEEIYSDPKMYRKLSKTQPLAWAKKKRKLFFWDDGGEKIKDSLFWPRRKMRGGGKYAALTHPHMRQKSISFLPKRREICISFTLLEYLSAAVS